jgi:hypothetical protein
MSRSTAVAVERLENTSMAALQSEFERIPSLLYRKSFITTAASTVKYSSCKDLGVHSLELLCLTDGTPPPASA